jgi:predicted N-acetyltransferase YhbS
VLIRPADAVDGPEIDALLDIAFGSGRTSRTASRLRLGASPLVGPSLIARCDDATDCPKGRAGELFGTIQFWSIMLVADGSDTPLTLLGPVAVALPARSLGLGRRLIAASLAVADTMQIDPILLIGDLSYYGAFGFTAAATGDWTLPGPVERDRLLLRQRETLALPRVARIVAVAHADSVPAHDAAMVNADG